MMMSEWRVDVGDCREVMAAMDAASVDAVVTDPPYGLSFMGKGWDHAVPGVEFWTEALRVAKPGAHLLAFGGTRLYHRLTVAIEDAGWEVRDCLMWLYGSGFPKSHNIHKSTCDDAWDGWGTALKPAWEPIVLARKPLDGTVAYNTLTHGVGGINVDGCRVGADVMPERESTGERLAGNRSMSGHNTKRRATGRVKIGRWPSNLVHDGSDEATSGMGDAARYFYCAKASKGDRNDGLQGRAKVGRLDLPEGKSWATTQNPYLCGGATVSANHHPTVKPTDLMTYLCRLVTPPNGVVLDPFCGSGSTGKAAVREGFDFIGIELNDEYADVARRRIEHEASKGGPCVLTT